MITLSCYCCFTQRSIKRYRLQNYAAAHPLNLRSDISSLQTNYLEPTFHITSQYVISWSIISGYHVSLCFCVSAEPVELEANNVFILWITTLKCVPPQSL